jgi:dTDP-4-amino-4,6-dideoxygalactose transaminase
MEINKKQSDTNNFKFYFYEFISARSAFEHVLTNSEIRTILLPGYIGYSTREGSGVFDPVRNSNKIPTFYRLNKNLTIDIPDLTTKLHNQTGSIVLIIHYFGFIDPNISEIRQIVKDNNCLLIEDYAHAYFSFLKRPVLKFDFAFFSLHKQFPSDFGGLLLSKKLDLQLAETLISFPFWNYNYFAISQKRRSNFMYLLNIFKNIKEVELLHSKLPRNIVPQTFPLLLKNKEIRDHLYFKLNENGFGAVSLYHELIDEIPSNFNIERNVSDRILNLPVHQDTNPSQLKLLTKCFFQLLTQFDKI